MKRVQSSISRLLNPPTKMTMTTTTNFLAATCPIPSVDLLGRRYGSAARSSDFYLYMGKDWDDNDTLESVFVCNCNVQNDSILSQLLMLS